MAYNLKPRTRDENLMGVIAGNPNAEPGVTPKTRREAFLADIAENGGGGGGLPEVTSDDNGDFLGVVDGEWAKAPAPSSLPPYTSADKGKVLTVGETLLPVIVIPEQTITAESGQPVPVTDYDDAFFSSAAQGDKITATYNGNTAELTATVDHDILTFAGRVGVPILVLYVPDGDAPGGMTEGVYLVGAPDTYTITASAAGSAPSVEPKWEAAGGALVISASLVPDTTNIQLSETFDTIEQNMLSGKPVIVAVPVAITDYVHEGAYSVTSVLYQPDPNGQTENDVYYVSVDLGGYITQFTATGRNAYPYVNLS